MSFSDFRRRRLLLGVYLACGAAAGAISFGLGQSKNLEVFRHASATLLAGRDLYDGSSVDWFKYSPTFALLFVPLAVIPAWMAAVVWGALNFGAAFAGIEAVAGSRARVALLAALPGVLLATDGDQANLLVVGAMLYAFASFERGRSATGAIAVALATLVKIFPIAAALFAIPHRDRERSLFRVIVALGIGLGLPLTVISPSTLAAEYASWLTLLRADHANLGWSIVTVVRERGGSANAVQLLVGLALVLPFLASTAAPTDGRFRRLAAAATVIAIVLGNHRSEYASFVISAVGVGLWFAEGRATPARIALLVLASVAHGPIFVRDDPVLTGTFSFLAAHRQFHPLRLLPLALIWLSIQRDLVLGFANRVQPSARKESRA
jgi:hypothetical protein